MKFRNHFFENQFEIKLSSPFSYWSSFPIKIKFVTVKRLSKPWLSKAILNSVKTKSKYFKLHISTWVDKSNDLQ